MTLESQVLRALLVLSRRAKPTPIALLAHRAGADEKPVRRTLVALARAGLVQKSPKGPRLTLTGLAVAVAISTASPRAKRLTGVPAVGGSPMLRRRRAA